jgi:hypothetical protein
MTATRHTHQHTQHTQPPLATACHVPLPRLPRLPISPVIIYIIYHPKGQKAKATQNPKEKQETRNKKRAARARGRGCCVVNQLSIPTQHPRGRPKSTKEIGEPRGWAGGSEAKKKIKDQGQIFFFQIFFSGFFELPPLRNAQKRDKQETRKSVFDFFPIFL